MTKETAQVEMKVSARDRLIVALDVETAGKALEIVAALKDYAGMFKIGSQLFTAAGPGVVREMIAAGARIFLDLKFHDIPNTVARAGVEAARLGISIFNVHAVGGSEMMRRTVAEVHEASLRENLTCPSIIAVTALTSADGQALSQVGFSSGVEEQVGRLARLAAECGMDGVVASPHEVSLVRAAARQAERADFLVVTPGVRPRGVEHGDQKRVMTPGEAILAGSSYLVIGRPILEAADMTRAAEQIISEIEEAGK